MSTQTWRSRVALAERDGHFDVSDNQDAQTSHKDPVSVYAVERDLALIVATALFADAVRRNQFERAHSLLDAIEMHVAVMKSSNTNAGAT
jgi:hypothetical protein